MEIDYLNYDFATWLKRANEFKLETGKEAYAVISCPTCWRPVGIGRPEYCQCKGEDRLVITNEEIVRGHGLEEANSAVSPWDTKEWAEHG